MAEDGATDGVDFKKDRYCLDGAKLVAVDGEYGQEGTEYRTERDPFSKIVTHDYGDDGPLSFKVYRPDGQIATYDGIGAAHIPDSTDVRETVTLAYMLSEVADRNGNTIRYHYSVDDQPGDGLSVLLGYIDYTNNGLEDGRRQVSFIYDVRPDPAFAFSPPRLSPTTRTTAPTRPASGTSVLSRGCTTSTMLAAA